MRIFFLCNLTQPSKYYGTETPLVAGTYNFIIAEAFYNSKLNTSINTHLTYHIKYNRNNTH